MTALTALLDELDALRAKATPGPWVAEPNYRREDGCRCLSCWEPIPGSWDINPVDGPDCEAHGCFHAIRIGEADATLIVAAVNALPELVAKLRAVEALAQEWRYKGEFGWGPWQAGEGPDIEGQVLDEAASRILAALAAAVTTGADR